MSKFERESLNAKFKLSGKVETIDGKTIDFDKLKQKTFVCFGFFGCHPCEHELPVFVEMASKHPEVNFVYITFDAEKERLREFQAAGLKDFKPYANYYIVHMDRSEIDKLKLTMGYPTKYFMDEGAMVHYVALGGNPNEPIQDIRDRIASIIAKG